MSTLTVQNIQGSSSSGNTISVASGHKIIGTDAGSILAPESVLQTVSSGAFTTTVTISSTSFVATGHTVAITAKRANSRYNIRLSGGGWYDNGNSSHSQFVTFYKKVNSGSYAVLDNINATYGLLRMSGDGNTWNIKNFSAEWLDPTTTSVGDVLTYQVYARVNSNSSQYNAGDRGTPVLIVQEIAQ